MIGFVLGKVLTGSFYLAALVGYAWMACAAVRAYEVYRVSRAWKADRDARQPPPPPPTYCCDIARKGWNEHRAGCPGKEKAV